MGDTNRETYTCIGRHQDKNNAIDYYILRVNSTGESMQIAAGELMDLIRDWGIRVTNLTLTADNKLIDSSNTNYGNDRPFILTKTLLSKCNNVGSLKFVSCAPESLIAKAKLLGLVVDKYCDGVYIFTDIHHDDKMIVTDGVIYLPVDSSELFSNLSIGRISLDGVNARLVKNMSGMFWHSCIDKLNIATLHTPDIQDTSEMFLEFRSNELVLSRFNSKRLVNMRGMFEDCRVGKLDISNMQTSKASSISNMFDNAKIEELNISNMCIGSNVRTQGVFNRSNVKHLIANDMQITKDISINDLFRGMSVHNVDTNIPKILDWAGIRKKSQLDFVLQE